MKISYLIADPSGNTTAFVLADVPHRGPAARRVMDALGVEQVAFVHHGRMDMMGGEFCGNASRSFALVQALLQPDGTLAPLTGSRLEKVAVSGADQPLTVTIRREQGVLWAAIEMPLPAAVRPVQDALLGPCTLVQYPGISHIVLEDRPFSEAQLAAARALVAQSVPAGPARECFGLMYLSVQHLLPLVYVAATDTLIWESSCASGTCAVAAARATLTGQSTRTELFQPGGSLTCNAEVTGGTLTALQLDGPVTFSAMGTLDL